MQKDKTTFDKLGLIPRCLFIDLGGVLFFDEYVELYYNYQIFKNIKKYRKFINKETFFKYKKNLYPAFKNNWVHVILHHFLPKKIARSIISISWYSVLKNFEKLFKPYPSALNFLQKLTTQFPIYCLANQPIEAEKVLIELGFAKYFKNIFLDASLGYSKPDPRLFQVALGKIQMSAKHVLHIGDRLDNDIIPAIFCGLQAMKLTHPIEYPNFPGIPAEFCDDFYDSLQILWDKETTSKNLEYISCYSYAEVLQRLLH